MNKIFRSMLPMLALPLLATSCYFEEDDIFGEGAAQRIDTANDEIKAKLVAGSTGENYGWVMQYFVAGVDEARYEGFNLFAKFDEKGKVTMASNHRYLRNGHAGKYYEYESFYEMLREKGTVLAFNTWNDVLTVFSDPVDPSKAPGTIIEDGEGMAGDHNFLVMSYSDDEIVIRGERHYANSRLIRCDRPWQQYMDDVTALKSLIAPSAISYHYVICGQDTMYLVGLNSGRPDYRPRPNSNSSTTQSLVFTPDGFRMQDSVKIGESKFMEFKLAEDKTGLVSEDGNVRVVSAWDNYICKHTDLWEMDATLFSAEQQDIFAQIDTEIRKYNANWSLKSFGLGKSSGDKSKVGLVFTFYTNAAKSKTNQAAVELVQTCPNFGEAQIYCDANSDVDRNMTTINGKAKNMSELCHKAAMLLNGTYQLEPDNYFMPTAAAYKPISGGVAFKVAK